MTWAEGHVRASAAARCASGCSRWSSMRGEGGAPHATASVRSGGYGAYPVRRGGVAMRCTLLVAFCQLSTASKYNANLRPLHVLLPLTRTPALLRLRGPRALWRRRSTPACAG
jgi:hypothetical protein